MPIKVRCTMYNSSNVNPNIGCSSTRTHYYRIKNIHRCCKKTYIILCKYKHLNQWFHMAHFCMKVDGIKHVIIALLEHFSRWIKLYNIHVLLISSIEWILQFANISLALHLKCKLNMHLIALWYVIRSLFICTFVKLYHMRTVNIGTVAFKQK